MCLFGSEEAYQMVWIFFFICLRVEKKSNKLGVECFLGRARLGVECFLGRAKERPIMRSRI
jgi:hypothetical protein